ncbi:MAG: hypothetical protein IPL92_15605 [Saprospiraceae bacterium]|nr:hypothetical protein [Candidatus Opimibacter iunctus]
MPEITWLLVTVSEASLAHPSVMVMPQRFECRYSSQCRWRDTCTTSLRVETGIVPVMTGGELSITCITCDAVVHLNIHP